MNINYCLPIIKNNKKDILQEISENKKNYQYFEIWIDYIEDLDKEFIEDLIELVGNKLIFLFRRKNSEKSKLNFRDKLVILSILKEFKVFVDLDININKKEIGYLELGKGKILTIISYHNYKKTPTDRTLKSVVEKAKKKNPAIIKISTFCKGEFDALRLLMLQQELKKQKKKHIVLGMGKFGTITRVFGTLFGNEMIFAPVNIEEKSAEGQLTKKYLEKIFKALN